MKYCPICGRPEADTIDGFVAGVCEACFYTGLMIYTEQKRLEVEEKHEEECNRGLS